MEKFGIVRHGRWLAYGFNYGLRVRPDWLATAIVTSNLFAASVVST